MKTVFINHVLNDAQKLHPLKRYLTPTAKHSLLESNFISKPTLNVELNLSPLITKWPNIIAVLPAVRTSTISQIEIPVYRASKLGRLIEVHGKNGKRYWFKNWAVILKGIYLIFFLNSGITIYTGVRPKLCLLNLVPKINNLRNIHFFQKCWQKSNTSQKFISQ